MRKLARVKSSCKKLAKLLDQKETRTKPLQTFKADHPNVVLINTTGRPQRLAVDLAMKNMREGYKRRARRKDVKCGNEGLAKKTRSTKKSTYANAVTKDRVVRKKAEPKKENPKLWREQLGSSDDRLDAEPILMKDMRITLKRFAKDAWTMVDLTARFMRQQASHGTEEEKQEAKIADKEVEKLFNRKRR